MEANKASKFPVVSNRALLESQYNSHNSNLKEVWKLKIVNSTNHSIKASKMEPRQLETQEIMILTLQDKRDLHPLVREASKESVPLPTHPHSHLDNRGNQQAREVESE